MERLKPHSGCIAIFFSVAAIATSVSLARRVPNFDERLTKNESISDSQKQALQLGNAVNLIIRTNTVRWLKGEKPTGIRASTAWSEVVFLGSADSSALADLYRALVKLDHKGNFISSKGLKNLTETEAGDEYDIAVAQDAAAVATKALGQVRSVTVFDFFWKNPMKEEEWTFLTKLLAKITNFQETGRFSGIKKTTYRFEKPPLSAELSVENTGDKKRIVLTQKLENLQNKSVIFAQGAALKAENLAVTEEMRLAKRPVLWLVDTVRELPWIGAGPIEWLEGRFFTARDTVRRLSYKAFGDDFNDENKSEGEKTALVIKKKFEVPSGLEVGTTPTQVLWPPPDIEPPVFKREAAGEGVWQPSVPDFVKQLKGAPQLAYTTFTRPDPQRPYVKVHLIAMDMRQLNLHMVGGYEDPKPTTGSQGTGKIPRDKGILNRVVLAFNGAFKTLHGAYGMMVDKDVLLPPQDGAATVAGMDDCQVLVGSWPKGMGITKDMSSLRQNMDPIVENGVVNPRRRYLWGFTLDEDITNMNTTRSGICMNKTGSLIYAWGEDLTAVTLGIAMNAAGCIYGIHLDMNPFHTAFIYYRFEDYLPSTTPKYQAELAFKEMRFSPSRYVNGAPKDFFFATLKDSAPGPEWSYDGLAQPQPAFVPAVFTMKAGACDLAAIDMSRAAVAIDPGEIPAHLAPGSLQKKQDDNNNLLMDIPLGRWSSERGQVVGGALVARFKEAGATLAVDKETLKINEWPVLNDSNEPVDNAIQAEWLDENASRSDIVIAVGMRKERWLIAGEGEKACLARAFKDQGVDRALYFDMDGDAQRIALRGENKMISLKGAVIAVSDASNAALRISARPKNLGAMRLEEYFAQQYDSVKKNEKGIQ